jgi:hypothetical protein
MAVRRREVTKTDDKTDTERKMAMEFLLVTFREGRRVFADGDPVGITNHTLLIPPNEYIITLEGDGFAPPQQDVVVTGTSIMRPKVVAFT